MLEEMRGDIENFDPVAPMDSLWQHIMTYIKVVQKENKLCFLSQYGSAPSECSTSDANSSYEV